MTSPRPGSCLLSANAILENRLRSTAASSGLLARLGNTAALASIARTERVIPFWPRAEVELLQRMRIREIAVHAYETVPYYREAMDACGLRPHQVETPDDLRQLPLIDSSDLARAPLRFVSLAYRNGGCEVFNTSGSSLGVRKTVLWDHASLLLRPARGERDRIIIARLAGESWHQVMAREFLTNERRHTLARLLGIETLGYQRLLILPADFSSRTQRAINSERTVIPRRAVHYHHLPPTAPFEVAAAHIAAIRPRVVFSFGSYADQFFRFLDGARKEIPLPRLWVYLGDMVSPDGRAIADAMGCPLFSVYSATEAGTIGFQCDRLEGFHLNTDLCALRLVDGQGRDVPDGSVGEVVISALDNRATVLLNYRLGDRAVLSPDPCPCGRSLPLLVRLEGRCSEIVQLGDGRRLSSVTIEGLFRPELRRTIQAQIKQESPGSLRWRVVPSAGVDPIWLRSALVARARQVLGNSTTLSVDIVDGIARTEGGKFASAVSVPSASAEERDAPAGGGGTASNATHSAAGGQACPRPPAAAEGFQATGRVNRQPSGWKKGRDRRLGRADALVVFGAGVSRSGPSPSLRIRVMRAAQVYTEGCAPVILCSGGYSGGVSEATVMRGLLMELGVPAGAVIPDDGGTSTRETIRSAKGFGWRRVIVVSSDYHIRRILGEARRQGLEAVGCPARRPGPRRLRRLADLRLLAFDVRQRARELVAVAAYGLSSRACAAIERCVGHRVRSAVVQARARWRSFAGGADATADAGEQIAELIRRHATTSSSACAVSLREVELTWPIAGAVTSSFGLRHRRLHSGLDIRGHYGSAVRPAAQGKVLHAGRLGPYGNTVVVEHDGGLATVYGHLAGIVVAEYDDLCRDQVMGYVGTTGRSSGPHLHFEVRIQGAPVDPLVYLGAVPSPLWLR